MDVFYEQLYKRRKQPKDIFAQVLIFLGCVALSGAAWLLLSIFIPQLFHLPRFLGSSLGMLSIFGIVWIGYKQIMRFDREFEYSYLNGEVDVDCIYTKTERKRVVTFKVKDFEIFGEYTPEICEKFKNSEFDSRLDFSSYDKNSKNKICFAVVKTRQTGKTFMIFEPEERILSDMQKYCRLGTGL